MADLAAHTIVIRHDVILSWVKDARAACRRKV
jgi:hypothetical protein